MKILIDAQLPPGLGLLLNQAGHDACHVFEIGLRDADDAQVWDYAVREGTAILTKDEDFAAWPDDHLAQNRELLAGRSRTVARTVIVLDRGVCRGGRKRH